MNLVARIFQRFTNMTAKAVENPVVPQVSFMDTMNLESAIIHARAFECPPGYHREPGMFVQKDGTREDAFVCDEPRPISIDYLKGGESIKVPFAFDLKGGESPESKL